MANVGAVILAAGGSSRFGEPKQLLRFQGESLVRRAVRAANEAGCVRVAVVTGDISDRIRTELRETSAAIVANPEWRKGIGTSIRCGVEDLRSSEPGLSAVVILACDQPFVDANAIAALVAQSETTGKAIVASHYANTLGVPALFDASCFYALVSLPDESGAKSLIEFRCADVAQINFEPGAIDIDTPADYDRLTSGGDAP